MKIKKLLTLFLAGVGLVTSLGLSSCGVNGSGTGNTGDGGCSSETCGGDISINLDAINDYLKNDPHWETMNKQGNKVTLIPFTHINGPRAEWNFFAFVNFERKIGSSYYRYQVTYLSCTCRSNRVNYWQTAYVELTIPDSGNIDDIELRKLSFDVDGTGEFLAGFWGDSGALHDINYTGITYEDIKTGFIPFLVGKTYAQLSSYDGFSVESNGQTITYQDTVWGIDPNEFAEDMNGVMFHGEHQVTLDDFTGASVSTNNILRMLIPLMEYHAANNI